MMNLRKVLAVLLAVAMLFTAAACGKTNETAEGTTQAQESTTAGQSSEAAMEPAKEPITIKMHIGNFNGPSGPAETDFFKTVVKDKFAMSIELIQGGDQNGNKLAAMMASNDLPDFLEIGDVQTITNLKKGDFLLPLDELVEKYGPDIKQNAPVMLQFIKDTYGDGKLYFLGRSVGPDVPVGSWHVGFYVMWDVFKKAGGQVPETMDGMLDLFKKMQEAYPKNDKGQKAYPLSIWKDWDGNNGLSFMTYVLSDMYGKHIGEYNGSLVFTEYDTATNVARWMYEDDGFYFKGLQWLNKAHKMGLLDPDSITQKFDTAYSKVTDGRRSVAFWGWEAGAWSGNETVSKEPMRGMMPIYAKDSVLTENPDNKAGVQQFYGISAKSQYADRIAELLNYMYSIEGNQTIWAGIEGKDWEIRDGKINYTPDRQALIKSGKGNDINDPTCWFGGLSDKTMNPVTGERFTSASWSEWIKLNQNDRDKDYSATFGGALNPEDYCRKNLQIVQKDNFKGFTAQPPDDIKVIQTKMGDVVKQLSWKMVYAKDEAQFNKLKEELVSKVKALGAEKEYEWEKQELANAKAKAEKYK